MNYPAEERLLSSNRFVNFFLFNNLEIFEAQQPFLAKPPCRRDLYELQTALEEVKQYCIGL
ncbi:MAG TPA: hypothetical protein DCE71_04330 [Parachlamydiales bacterium]|nr:hypothetical protein [Parachlamydiales bacterium]